MLIINQLTKIALTPKYLIFCLKNCTERYRERYLPNFILLCLFRSQVFYRVKYSCLNSLETYGKQSYKYRRRAG
jgi:hypothetical protein